ncbi:hypothetical protein EFP84_00265 [Leptospira kmetyi]|uniref:Lipoprotein n=1 Tax=Leptospira kmetyi TaxID=408139 RepID=A0AAD0UM23_9LEPT|nr:hypothetical protein EFP84_00265 [Leptospira kmetyi]
MKKMICTLKRILFLILFINLSSCEDWNQKPVQKGHNELIYFLATYAPQPYDAVCQNPNLATPLSLNTPVTLGSFSQTYSYSTGTSGLKYAFTLSGDYPSCGVTLAIYTCDKPNIIANNSLTSCDIGNYQNHVSGGTQTCLISSFSNRLVLVSIQPNSTQYPSTKCTTITFEVKP